MLYNLEDREMAEHKFPNIRDLAIIGDRHTAAIVTTQGEIVWYCPERFDSPSLLASLLDPEKGGVWTVQSPNLKFARRRYREDSGVLETTFAGAGSEWHLTDWMPYDENLPRGLCRWTSAVPNEVTLTLRAAPNYARRAPNLRKEGDAVRVGDRDFLYASHPLIIDGEAVSFTIPPGESGWAMLVNETLSQPGEAQMKAWLETTLENWRKVAARATYTGPYEGQVADSIRVLRLLTFEENGGIIAAATTSLPEVVGGKRNYDYRYVWLRDAGMIVRALTRAGSDGTEERQFLNYLCGFGCHSGKKLPLEPFSTLDGDAVCDEEILDFVGYRSSSPVRIGNGARQQLQLDAYGNVLLAAQLIYNRFETREHWSTIERIADYLTEHWRDRDNSFWEEREQYQYTASKALVACGLEQVARFGEEEQARRWRKTVEEIRHFIADRCLTSEGAYAVIAGSEAVDVSAALFPIWGYTAPDAPEMVATMKALERDLATGHLYRRHLEQFDSQREGAFLAGTFWVAQYWVMRRDFQRVEKILEAAFEYANDLGLFAEEAEPNTGQMLGNFPQTFVHSAFISTVVELKMALQQSSM
ncbi:MAG: glycoside hydrolase family 15 protein [Cyanobacteriota bacterium]|nr:glycoside hydrolase family 15 protein [Cyanobacteriota bacterium]